MLDKTVHIVGVGGIGSWTAGVVARIGCRRLVLHDDDIVEPHNLDNQNYDIMDIGRPKVLATQMHLYGLASLHHVQGQDMRIDARQERVNSKSIFRGIVIVAVDSAQARKDIFAACKYNPGISLYIEAGAAEDMGVVRVLVPHDKDHVMIYEELLDSYSAEGPAPCVSPYMGPQFASVIGYWVSKIETLGRPLVFTQTIFNYTEGPHILTIPEINA